jgi:hypothetical protein
MANIDLGRYLRLQGAIQAALDAVDQGNAVVGAEAMRTSYTRLREEARSAIPDEQAAEFNRLFPAELPQPTARHSPQGLDAVKYMTARSLLASLKGWLDGYVSEVRIGVEAEAYAKERVKAERGVGF